MDNIFDLSEWRALRSGDYNQIATSPEALKSESRVSTAEDWVPAILAARAQYEKGSRAGLLEAGKRFSVIAQSAFSISLTRETDEPASIGLELLHAINATPEPDGETRSEKGLRDFLRVELVHFLIKQKASDAVQEAAGLIASEAVSNPQGTLETLTAYRAALARGIIASRHEELEPAISAFADADGWAIALKDFMLRTEIRFWRGQAFAWRIEKGRALEELHLASAGWLVLENVPQAMLTNYEIASLYRDLRMPVAALDLFRSVLFQQTGKVVHESEFLQFPNEAAQALSSSDVARTTQSLAAALIINAEEAQDQTDRDKLARDAEGIADLVIACCREGDRYRATMACLNSIEAALLQSGPDRGKARRTLDLAIKLQSSALEKIRQDHRLRDDTDTYLTVVDPLTPRRNGTEPISSEPQLRRNASEPAFELIRLAETETRLKGLKEPFAAAERLSRIAALFGRRSQPAHEAAARALAAEHYLMAARGDASRLGAKPEGTQKQDSAQYIREDQTDEWTRGLGDMLRHAERELHRVFRVSEASGISLRNQGLARLRRELASLRAKLDGDGTGLNAYVEPVWLHANRNFAVGGPADERGVETSFFARDLNVEQSVFVKIYDLSQLDHAYHAAGAGFQSLRDALNEVIRNSSNIRGIPTLGAFSIPEEVSQSWFAFATERVQGRPLRDYMRPARTEALKSKVITDSKSILRIVYDLAETLRELQLWGVTCCMLSPTAVLLEPGARPVIVSFGAIQRGGSSMKRDFSSAWLAPYIPPSARKQIAKGRGVTPDESWDVYALGVLLAQWLLGVEGTIRTEDWRPNGPIKLFRELLSVLIGVKKPLPLHVRQLVYNLLRCGEGKGPIENTAQAAKQIDATSSYL